MTAMTLYQLACAAVTAAAILSIVCLCLTVMLIRERHETARILTWIFRGIAKQGDDVRRSKDGQDE